MVRVADQHLPQRRRAAPNSKRRAVETRGGGARRDAGGGPIASPRFRRRDNWSAAPPRSSARPEAFVVQNTPWLPDAPNGAARPRRCHVQQDNPKKGASADRYDTYKHARTLQEILDLGGSRAAPARRNLGRAFARRDRGRPSRRSPAATGGERPTRARTDALRGDRRREATRAATGATRATDPARVPAERRAAGRLRLFEEALHGLQSSFRTTGASRVVGAGDKKIGTPATATCARRRHRERRGPRLHRRRRPGGPRGHPADRERVGAQAPAAAPPGQAAAGRRAFAGAAAQGRDDAARTRRRAAAGQGPEESQGPAAAAEAAGLLPLHVRQDRAAPRGATTRLGRRRRFDGAAADDAAAAARIVRGRRRRNFAGTSTGGTEEPARSGTPSQEHGHG